MFAIVVLVTLVIIIGSYVATQQRLGTPAQSASVVDRAEPDRPALLVIGDSFSGGSSAEGGPKWPDLLGEEEGWTVETAAANEASFVSRGGRPTLQDQVEGLDVSEDPDLVLVAGGRYDTGKGNLGRIGRAATKLLDTAARQWPEAEVVLLSNFASGVPTPDGMTLAEKLAQVAEDEGVGFLNVTGFLSENDIADDRVNPSSEGQVRLAGRIGADLADDA